MNKWILLCVASLGCNSSTPPVGNDSGPQLPCSTQQPTAGDTCDAGGLTCEYGSDLNIACNTVYQCNGNVGAMAWDILTFDAGATCPTTIPALDPSCPKNPPSGSCDEDAGTPLCHYPSGYCTCVSEGVDKHWACDSTTPCPEPRPTLGVPCSNDELRCYYLDCNVPWGSAVVCTDGTWHHDDTAPCGI